MLDFLADDVVAEPVLDFLELWADEPDFLDEEWVAEPDLCEEVVAELAPDLCEDVVAEPEPDLCEDVVAELAPDLCEEVVAEEDFLEDAVEDFDSMHFFSKVNLYPVSHISHTEFGHFAQCSIEVHLSSSEKIIPSFRNNNKINNLLVDIIFF